MFFKLGRVYEKTKTLYYITRSKFEKIILIHIWEINYIFT